MLGGTWQKCCLTKSGQRPPTPTRVHTLLTEFKVCTKPTATKPLLLCA